MHVCNIVHIFIISLDNLSEEIRWSFDFRWQRSDLPVGFHGLKEGVLMRTADNPDHVIDWEPFDSVDRHKEQHTSMGKVSEHST